MGEWPADKVERRKVADLVPYARNARTHTADQVNQLAASIREWGWTNPVLIDPDGTIIAGHGRVLAAQKLGIEEVPCMIAKGWTEAQRRAYVLADNKLALNAGWDDDLLRTEFGQLQEMKFDLSVIGFDEGEIALAIEGWNSDIKIPEAPADEHLFVIKVKVDRDVSERAKAVISSALSDAGIEHEL